MIMGMRLKILLFMLILFTPTVAISGKAFALEDEPQQTIRTNCKDDSNSDTPCGDNKGGIDLQTLSLWPNLRFRDNGDETITDNLTKLIWTKDDNAPGPWVCWPGTAKNWWGMENYIDCLNKTNYLGRNDWRIPTVNQIERLLVDFGGFKHQWPESAKLSNIRSHYYWTTVDLALIEYENQWMLYKLTYPPYAYNKTYNYYVWPVCSKQK